MPSTVPATFTSPRVAKTLAEFGIFTQVHVSPSWTRPKVAVKVMSRGPIADLGMATSSVTRGGLVVDDHGLCSQTILGRETHRSERLPGRQRAAGPLNSCVPDRRSWGVSCEERRSSTTNDRVVCHRVRTSCGGVSRWAASWTVPVVFVSSCDRDVLALHLAPAGHRLRVPGDGPFCVALARPALSHWGGGIEVEGALMARVIVTGAGIGGLTTALLLG